MNELRLDTMYKEMNQAIEAVAESIQKHDYHFIITLNSSKLSLPSPFKSKRAIMALHWSMDVNSPNFLSILFKALGVMKPHRSVSYKSKASLKSFTFSSSSTPSIISTKSSKQSNPSPSESNASITISASLIATSPPTIPIPFLSSHADIFPSPSSSKCLSTRSYSPPFIIISLNKQLITCPIKKVVNLLWWNVCCAGVYISFGLCKCRVYSLAKVCERRRRKERRHYMWSCKFTRSQWGIRKTSKSKSPEQLMVMVKGIGNYYFMVL